MIPEADLGLRCKQVLDSARDQHFAGARFGGDAGADVEGKTNHLAAAHRVFARVQADPDIETKRAHRLLDHSDTVTLDKVQPVTIKAASDGVDQTTLMLMGGVARSLQIAGALESMLDISVRYSNERVAFEKKISKFQAVQHNLARLAGESAAALAAATSAADAIANAKSFNDEVYLEAAAAKIRCAEAAEKGGGIAHQVHGAIGFTIEHILHRYSLRALAWRDDFGSESHWAVELGELVASRGADELWPLVASR